MPKRTFRLLGAGSAGTKISASLLADLLQMLVTGSRRAVRMRIEGRSAAAGSKPRWLERASSFNFTGISEGSCVVEIEAPPSADAAPDRFLQKSFLLDHDRSGLDYWEESLAEAIAGKEDSDLFDPVMLSDFDRSLTQVFSHSVTSIEMGSSRRGAPV